MSLHKLELIGNIGKDAEVYQFPDESFAISFPLATKDKWKDKNGDKQERTTWYKCIQYSKNSKIAQYLKKGQLMQIEGKPNATAYIDRSGNAAASLECIIKDLRFLGSSKDSTSTPPPPSNLPPSINGDFTSDNDDDLPF